MSEHHPRVISCHVSKSSCNSVKRGFKATFKDLSILGFEATNLCWELRRLRGRGLLSMDLEDCRNDLDCDG